MLAALSQDEHKSGAGEQAHGDGGKWRGRRGVEVDEVALQCSIISATRTRHWTRSSNTGRGEEGGTGARRPRPVQGRGRR